MNELNEQIFKTSLSKIDLELAKYYNSPQFTQALLIHGRKNNDLPKEKSFFSQFLKDYQNQIPTKAAQIAKQYPSE